MTNLFKNEGKQFSEKNRAIVTEQILRALNYMHMNNLVHRDIKSENVVYSDVTNSEGKLTDFSKLEVKLIDFGFSQISMKGQSKLKEFVGTPYFIAPEIINEDPYGSKCDIWSLGVLVYQSISGDFPFNGRNRNELFKRIVSGNFSFKSNIWCLVSAECRSFIRACLTLDQA